MIYDNNAPINSVRYKNDVGIFAVQAAFIDLDFETALSKVEMIHDRCGDYRILLNLIYDMIDRSWTLPVTLTIDKCMNLEAFNKEHLDMICDYCDTLVDNRSAQDMKIEIKKRYPTTHIRWYVRFLDKVKK